MNSTRALVYLSILLYLTFGCLSASASVITFDAFEAPGGSAQVFSNPVEVGDFRFTAIDGAGGHTPATFQQSSPFYNGSAALLSTSSSDILMTRIDSGVFDVFAVDLDSLFGNLADFELRGQLFGGGTVLQLFDADGALGNETVNLSGFQNITSLRFGGVGSSQFSNIGSVDNIVLTPEPRTALLFAIGLVGLAAQRRARDR